MVLYHNMRKPMRSFYELLNRLFRIETADSLPLVIENVMGSVKKKKKNCSVKICQAHVCGPKRATFKSVQKQTFGITEATFDMTFRFRSH
uniref:Uncharacterized protein n=1 Tax=Anguilla anguilla TaxID=7936 RepID=A0A0E9RH21_ANGAN